MSLLRHDESWTIRIDDGDSATQIIETLSQLPFGAVLEIGYPDKLWIKFILPEPPK